MQRFLCTCQLFQQDTVAEIKSFVNEKMSIPFEQMLFVCKGRLAGDHVNA